MGGVGGGVGGVGEEDTAVQSGTPPVTNTRRLPVHSSDAMRLRNSTVSSLSACPPRLIRSPLTDRASTSTLAAPVRSWPAMSRLPSMAFAPSRASTASRAASCPGTGTPIRTEVPDTAPFRGNSLATSAAASALSMSVSMTMPSAGDTGGGGGSRL